MKCRFCGSLDELTFHVRNKPRRDGSEGNIYYSCRDCNRQRAASYRQTRAGAESVRRSVKKYELKNPDRKYAWGKAQKFPVEPCIMCGKTPSDRHHPDVLRPDYIVFLCRLHHKQADFATKTVKVTV